MNSSISDRNSHPSPRSYLAAGYFSAVYGGIQAASRSHVGPGKPDVVSGAFTCTSENQRHIPVESLLIPGALSPVPKTIG